VGDGCGQSFLYGHSYSGGAKPVWDSGSPTKFTTSEQPDDIAAYRHPHTIGAARMPPRELSRSLRTAVEYLGHAPRPMRCPNTTRTFYPPTTRYFSTTPSPRTGNDNTQTTSSVSQTFEPFDAAPPIDFAARARKDGKKEDVVLSRLRVVPASPSYFSAKPTFTDDVINLSAILRKYATLPTIPTSEAPKVAWRNIDQYRIMTNEPVKTQRFHKMVHILRRLNCIHPSLMPDEVVQAMERFKKPIQPSNVAPPPGELDEWGRARGIGRRKTSSAVAYLVEGEGEVLINGEALSTFFGRLHHRESAVWALKATQRLDKYNLFGVVHGGGTTGQAEALTLAVAKALLVHEPALKPALRRGKPYFPIYIVHSHVARPVSYNRSFANLFPLQLAALPAIQGKWRGRRLVTSRRARCLPGSSVEADSSCTLFFVYWLLHPYYQHSECSIFHHNSSTPGSDLLRFGEFNERLLLAIIAYSVIGCMISVYMK
jgi:small subunit ribosomal protein S9